MSNLKNDFDPETYYLFEGLKCWWCGDKAIIINGDPYYVDVLHHILGRCSKSPLNAAPVHNKVCHLGNGKLSWPEVKLDFLVKTARYLRSINYDLTGRDLSFIGDHEDYFEKVNNRL